MNDTVLNYQLKTLFLIIVTRTGCDLSAYLWDGARCIGCSRRLFRSSPPLSRTPAAASGRSAAAAAGRTAATAAAEWGVAAPEGHRPAVSAPEGHRSAVAAPEAAVADWEAAIAAAEAVTNWEACHRCCPRRQVSAIQIRSHRFMQDAQSAFK